MSEDVDDAEAARLGCAGFAVGVGCAPFVILALILILLALGVALRDFQG